MAAPFASAPVQAPIVDQRGMVTVPWFQWFNQNLSPRVSSALQSVTLTGDVTGSGGPTFATTIALGAVTLAKMADLAGASLLGNAQASAATPQALSGPQVTAMLSLFSSDSRGMVPPSGGGSVNFLRADGQFTVPPPGGPAGGDLSGSYPNPVVAGLQGLALPTLDVTPGYLHWTGALWDLAAGGGGGSVGFGGIDLGNSGALASGSPGFNMGASA